MSNQRIWIIIISMGVLMALMRVLPIIFVKKEIKNRFLKSFLEYIPFAILTSLLFPEVFHSTSSLLSGIIGFAVAGILAFFGQGMIVVALSSVAAVFITEWFMKIF